MAILEVMGTMGHQKVQWDRKSLANGDPEAAAAVKEAESIFKESLKKGGAAFKVKADGETERIDKFNPQAERTIVTLPLAGG